MLVKDDVLVIMITNVHFKFIQILFLEMS